MDTAVRSVADAVGSTNVPPVSRIVLTSVIFMVSSSETWHVAHGYYIVETGGREWTVTLLARWQPEEQQVVEGFLSPEGPYLNFPRSSVIAYRRGKSDGKASR
jgi:hypothetical protein